MFRNEDYLKLPLEEQCVHKSWRARSSGYKESTKLFKQWNGDDHNWSRFIPLIARFVTDGNAVAQEKGLEATLALTENCDLAGTTIIEVIDGLVNKCLAAPKPETKARAKQIILMYCEIEQHETVLEELIKGLTHKNPKVVAGCINNMAECLKTFGPRLAQVTPMLKAVVPLLGHRDKAVRDEGKRLIVEAYRWIGEMVKPLVNGCQPIQMTELETEFKNLKGGKKAKPTRLLRSQQQVESPEDEGDGARDGREEEVVDTDPYELLYPVSILDKLPINFYELVVKKKWQHRKEALDALLPLSQTPKLASGDYNNLVRVLKKIIAKDTNVFLVALAAQCLAGLAMGLRTRFKFWAMQCFSTVLERFKEKKVTVVSALVEAVDAMYPCFEIDEIEAVKEDCLEALKHQTPTVNSETAKFLTRAFAKFPAALFTNRKLLKDFVIGLKPLIYHRDDFVRDAASEALGTIVKLIGEQSVRRMMSDDIDSSTWKKIGKFAEKAEIAGKMPKLQASEGSVDGSGSAVSNLKNIRFADEANRKLHKWNFKTPRSKFVDQLKEQMEQAKFNRTLTTQMFHTDFEQHLKAIETLSACIDSDLEGVISNLDLILKWTTLRFFGNYTVMVRVLYYLNDVFSALAADSYILHDVEAVSFIPYLVKMTETFGAGEEDARVYFRRILKNLVKVVPTKKLLPFLVDGLIGKERKEFQLAHDWSLHEYAKINNNNTALPEVGRVAPAVSATSGNASVAVATVDLTTISR